LGPLRKKDRKKFGFKGVGTNHVGISQVAVACVRFFTVVNVGVFGYEMNVKNLKAPTFALIILSDLSTRSSRYLK
jgi:hypothetical protein